MDAILWIAMIGYLCFGTDAFTFWWRLPAYWHALYKGYHKHEFQGHVRKDIGTVMNWCNVCKHREKNWIHPQKITDAAELDAPVGKPSKLLELETADIKWRFENDAEWVKVFGEEYDPKTFQPIPQFHNGECGGPNDSCERCAWEADQKEAAETQERHKKISEGHKTDKSKTQARADLANEYLKLMWTVWNTVHNPDLAQEEWEDIRDDILMEKDSLLRDALKKHDVWKRLDYCLIGTKEFRKRWKTREDTWHSYQKRIASSRYDYGY
jgi:hypothetical protein